MANTYTQIHIQLIFAVQYRSALISKSWKEDLYKYISDIVQAQKHKLIIINGVADHIHLLVGLKPHQSLSDLLQDIKGSSSKWINNNKLTNVKFAWQQGYGTFSYSYSHLPKVINYIKNQEQHHLKQSFTEEYLAFLKSFNIEYDEKYVLKEPM